METTRGYAYDENDASPYDRGTIAAIFDTPEQAKQALKDLHAADFKKTWMGATSMSSGTPSGVYEPATNTFTPEYASDTGRRVETVEGGGFGGALSRFFGETNQQSLHEALIHQGIPESDALALDHQLHDGGAIITVAVHDRYDEAMQILSHDRGSIGSSGAARPTLGSAAPQPRVPSGGQRTDLTDEQKPLLDEQKLTLSAERLSVDKQRVSAGEATISKKVVSEQESVDVPIMHEELFIARRPAAPGEKASGTIGADQTYRVPLMRDQVVVDKRTFVTEEVAIGKRAVAETQHVSDSVRHEELVVDDASGAQRTDPTVPKP